MISLKDKLNKLPPDKVAELERITDAIIETGLAEVILLYGSHARGDFKDGKIVDVGGSQVLQRSDYDILVVIDQPQEKREIDKTCMEFAEFAHPITIGHSEITISEKLREIDLPVQIIVEQVSRINRLLQEKQYFYSDIKREGIVLYDTGKCRLSEPPEEITSAVRQRYAEGYFKGWFKEAVMNLELSHFAVRRGEKDKDYFRQAAFHLEQVSEMCYKCILLVYSNYAASEHSLYTLRKEAEKFEPLLKDIFPLATKEQRESFKKLHLSYIGARYIMSFTVEQSEVDNWKSEVKNLLSLTEQTCKTKIAALKQVESENQNNNM